MDYHSFFRFRSHQPTTDVDIKLTDRVVRMLSYVSGDGLLQDIIRVTGRIWLNDLFGLKSNQYITF